MSTPSLSGRERQPVEVALFVTCLIDLFRPSAGFAAVKLLEEAGCEVAVPASQTCCGQPAYNSGDRKAAKEIAEQVIAAFEHYSYIVVPSGSCAGMLCKHYPELFDPETEPSWHARASAFAARVFELTSFLSDVLRVDFTGRAYPRRVTYHDSCSSFREMGVAAQPRKLLQSLDGITFVEMSDREVCCGFGGTFLDQISRYFQRNGYAEGRPDRRNQGGSAYRRRSWLPDEHRRQAGARRKSSRGAPHCRDTGGRT